MPKENKSLGHAIEKDTNDVKEEDCSESLLRKIPVEYREEPVTFACPVCGKLMSEPHSLDVQSVITKGWYFIQKTRIFDSKVVSEHEFDHYRDEEENIGMEESHSVVTVISGEFDGIGKCTVFDILEIRPCDTEDSMKINRWKWKMRK